MLAFLDALCAALLARHSIEIFRLLGLPAARKLPREVREEAVLIAYQKSRIGDTVLLSPGASSFDMFDSDVERGNYFKEIVNKFK